MIIGEEQLPKKLKRWEKVDGRVLEWVAADAVSFDDTQLVARLYAKDVVIETDLLDRVYQLARGSVRRVVVNIDSIRNESLNMGWKSVDLARWGNRPFYTGEPPARAAR
jgi:hypothetical protein